MTNEQWDGRNVRGYDCGLIVWGCIPISHYPGNTHLPLSSFQEKNQTSKIPYYIKTCTECYPSLLWTGWEFSQFSSVQLSNVRLLILKWHELAAVSEKSCTMYNVWRITSYYPGNIPRDDQDLKKYLFHQNMCTWSLKLLLLRIQHKANHA